MTSGRSRDNPFHTLDGWGSVAYVANLRSYAFKSIGVTGQIAPLDLPAPSAGPSSFDKCGAWLNSTWRGASIVRGWYHSESCDGPARKSVAYAESHDEGLTFTKPGYPANQVITAVDAGLGLIGLDAVPQATGSP